MEVSLSAKETTTMLCVCYRLFWHQLRLCAGPAREMRAVVCRGGGGGVASQLPHLCPPDVLLGKVLRAAGGHWWKWMLDDFVTHSPTHSLFFLTRIIPSL